MPRSDMMEAAARTEAILLSIVTAGAVIASPAVIAVTFVMSGLGCPSNRAKRDCRAWSRPNSLTRKSLSDTTPRTTPSSSATGTPPIACSGEQPRDLLERRFWSDADQVARHVFAGAQWNFQDRLVLASSNRVAGDRTRGQVPDGPSQHARVAIQRAPRAFRTRAACGCRVTQNRDESWFAGESGVGAF